MRLFTKEIDKQLFAQYSKGSDLENQMVVAKIFNPYGRGTWYLLNSDPEDPDYIWAIVDLFEVEMGSVSRSELESIKVPPFNLGFERDLYFEPVNAAELYKGLLEGKIYKKGGATDNGNAEMLRSNAKAISHHAKELQDTAKGKDVEAWVVAKSERAATDLSDVTHYLDGKEYANGGRINEKEKEIEQIEKAIVETFGFDKEDGIDINDLKYIIYNARYQHLTLNGRFIDKTRDRIQMSNEFDEISTALEKRGWKIYNQYSNGGYMKKGGSTDVYITNEMRGEDNDEYGTFELFKRGGKVEVKILNRDEAFSKSKYEWLLGDFDKDGLANVDDKSPYDADVRDRIDSPSIENGVTTILDLKNTMDKNMYSFVEDLKNISPDNSKIYARTKTPYSIIDKLIKKRLLNPKTGLTDLIGTTIVTNDKKELDGVKKVVESGKLGRVIELEDMYANPKQGYRAYHFLVEKNGMPIELQLKTKRQKALNELSHEPYKLGKLDSDKLIHMTEVANQADNGNKEAIEEYNEFMKQPDLEKVFYKYADGGYMAGGGKIKDQYEGREAEDIWNNLSKMQRQHFLYDHASEIENYRGEEFGELKSSEIIKAYNSDFSNLDKHIRNRFENHVRQGQYAKGGYMAGGGNIPSIEKKVEEVNRLIKLGNDNNLTVVDASNTWQAPMKYKPFKYSNGVLYEEYEELDLYSYNKRLGEKWNTKKDKVLKANMQYDSPLNQVAKMYRKALKDAGVVFEDGGYMAKGGSMNDNLEKLNSLIREKAKKSSGDPSNVFYISSEKGETVKIGEYDGLKPYSAQAYSDGELKVSFGKDGTQFIFSTSITEIKEDRESYEKYKGVIYLYIPLTESQASEIIEKVFKVKMAKGGYMAKGGEIEKRLKFVNDYYKSEVKDAKKRGNYYGYTQERITKGYYKDLKQAQKGKEFDNFLLEEAYQVQMNNKILAEGGMMAKDGGEIEGEFRDARYAKGKIAYMPPKSENRFKNREMRLAEAKGVSGKWSHRENAYIMSKGQAETLKKYLREGKDASSITGKVYEKDEFAKGGKVGFSDKVKAIKQSLLKRKKVSPKVQKDYGKTYSPKEAEDSAKRIVGAMTASERLKSVMKKHKK